MDRYKENLIKAYDRLSDQGLYLLLTENPWEWRKEPNLVLEIRKNNQKEVVSSIENRSFLKIHRYIDFDSPDFIKGTLVQVGRKIFRLTRSIVEK